MNHVLPASGTSPIPMNPGTNVASDEPMRTSHAHASERPAPATGPLTAAITGFSSARIARMFGWYVCSSALADAARERLELAQVLARAEAAPRAGEDDRADLRIGRLAQRGREPVVHGPVDRVVDVRPVERDRQNRAVARR